MCVPSQANMCVCLCVLLANQGMVQDLHPEHSLLSASLIQ